MKRRLHPIGGNVNVPVKPLYWFLDGSVKDLSLILLFICCYWADVENKAGQKKVFETFLAN